MCKYLNIHLLNFFFLLKLSVTLYNKLDNLFLKNKLFKLLN